MSLLLQIKHKVQVNVTVFLLFILSISPAVLLGQARITESTQAIKTYPFGDPNPVPLFNSRPEIYPYFRFDGYSSTAKPQDWKVVQLENDYIKLSVLPEVGGKVFGAIEKSTGNEFIYKNDVLKFRDIALRGPWTSGGIEFNFGYIGHTPSTATPVDYLIKESKDGSVSAYIGGLDLSSRTQWRVEIRLPDSTAAFQTKSFWYNATALNQSYYYWSNAAIHAGEDLEFYFPGTNYISHGGQAYPWPVNDSGRNLSLYRENDFGGAKSNHVIGTYQDYSAGYWHKKNFGYSHWSRHNEMPGQKIFLWALSRQGGIWEDLLTDTAGQYVEVQSGRMLNQAILESGYNSPFGQYMFQPHAADRWSESWSPVKSIGGISEASAYGSMNVSREDQKLKIAISPTKPISDSLNIFSQDREIAAQSVDLEPIEVFQIEVDLAEGVNEFTVALGNKLTYQYPSKDSLKRPIKNGSGNSENSTISSFKKAEELMAIRKYDKALEAYQKVLQQNPDYRRAQIRTAELYVRRGEYEQALHYVRNVLEEDTYNVDANFVYGIANRKLGRFTQAKDGFGWAARSMEYRSAGFAQMAEIYLHEKKLEDAVYYAQKALDFNTMNISALAVKAVAYRLMGKKSQVEEAVGRILEIDPLSHFARFEKYLLAPDEDSKNKFTSLIRNELPHETYLELGIKYYNLGRSQDAEKLLQLAPEQPIVHYWLAYLNRDESDRGHNLQRALKGSPNLVFPFRSETIAVLNWALGKQDHWKSRYYLGLLLWHKGREKEAVNLFQQNGDSPDFAPFYLTRSDLLKNRNPKQAEQDLEHALELNSQEWRTYRALSEWHVTHNDLDKALNISQKAHKQFPDNYYLGMQHASILNQKGEFKQALQELEHLTILPYEGAREGHQLYKHAHLMLALQDMKDKNYKSILQHIEKSRKWPENLGSGRPFNPDERFQDFVTAQVHRKQGESALADNYKDSVMVFSNKNWNTIKEEGFTKDNFVSYLIYKDEGEKQKAQNLLKKFKEDLDDKKFKLYELEQGLDGSSKSSTVNNEEIWLNVLREVI